MTALDVSTSARIAAPLDLVATFTAHPDNAPVWHRSVTGVDWLSGRRVGVGAKVVFHTALLGREVHLTSEITDFTPGKTMTMLSTDGPFPMGTTYLWEADGPDATTMTIRNFGDPTGFSRMAAPLLARAVRRAATRDLANLAGLTEAMSGRF